MNEVNWSSRTGLHHPDLTQSVWSRADLLAVELIVAAESSERFIGDGVHVRNSRGGVAAPASAVARR